MCRMGIGVFLAVVIAATPFAAVAQGDGKPDAAKEEAKAHFEAGLALFKAEKYEAAALELEASVKLFPTKGGLFNLANIYKVLSRYDEAIDAIFRLETEYSDKIDKEMRAAVVKMKSEIDGLAAKLDISVSAEGAAVSVDGRKVGTSPLPKEVLVDPGNHTVTASLPGRKTAESKVQVISRQVVQVALTLEAEDAATPAAAPVGPTTSPNSKVTSADESNKGDGAPKDEGGKSARKKLSPGWFWGGLGATIAFGGGTVAMEFVARSKSENIKTEEDKKTARTTQIIGIALLGVTGAAAVTTAVLAAVTDFKKGKKQKKKSVAATFAPNGFAVHGSF